MKNSLVLIARFLIYFGTSDHEMDKFLEICDGIFVARDLREFLLLFTRVWG